MALDGFFINRLTTEINKEIINNRLEKIEQISNDVFSFSFYSRGIRNNLFIKLNSPNASFFLGNKSKNVETIKSNLLENLKKHLTGTILTNLTQHGNDRVVIFTFTGNDLLEGRVEKKLVLELMGRYNNLILTKDNIIIDAFHKKFSDSSRSILPKLEFSFFPNDKENFSIDDLLNIEGPKYLSVKYIGFSPLLSNYLFNNKINFLDIDINPTKDLTTNKFYWFDLFDEKDNKKHYPSLSKLLESNALIVNLSGLKHLNFINNLLDKNLKRLEKTNESFDQAQENLLLKNNADAIYQSGKDLNKNYSEITNYNGELIKLDSLISLNQNAQKLYARYHKAKRTINHLTNQKAELLSLISLLEQLKFDLESDSNNLNDILDELVSLGFKNKKKKPNNKKEIDILKLEFEGYTYYVGKNNKQNEYITNTIGKHNDYWFHVKDYPGSHVVLKGELTNRSLEIGAMLAAKHSKLASTELVSVNYTKIKNLKKIPKIPGYQVILKEYETLNIKIDHQLITSIFNANQLK